ncbi:hypothetical protein ACFWUQ_18345 [Streptomyces sp. NPDC058662]|uniref:hypothetical protein n=1 Tax=Streptomyces sp. NPDC058662 TaxID=3346583 RepID=UPI0036635AF6
MSKSRNRVLQGLLTTALAVGTLFAAPATASASTCGINAGGHQGYYICEYPPTLVQWPDGHYQWFVVGTDNHVYDSTQLGAGSPNWGAWYDLGGVAKSSVEVTYLTSSRIDLRVWGTYSGYWCKRWTGSGGWTNWWDC